MVGWPHRLNGHEFEQAPGDSEGQGSLVQPMGLQRAGCELANKQQFSDRKTSSCENTPWATGFDPWVGKFLWRREGQSTLVFLPGEFHGQRSLAGYSPWGHKELDTTE